MQLIFQGGNELVKLVIDRENKELKISSSKTGYKLVPSPWKNLFDKGKERIQEKITDKLNDGDFKKSIIMAMAQQGYQLRKVN